MENRLGSIKVAVRGRPTLPEEDQQDATQCIHFPNNTSIIVAQEKEFKLDYAFNQLTSQEEIYNEFIFPLVENFINEYLRKGMENFTENFLPTKLKSIPSVKSCITSTNEFQQSYPNMSTDQRKRCNKGVCCTVMAYGQTGSGKSYTMGSEYRARPQFVTLHENIGIIPRILKDIFSLKNKNSDPIEFQVSFLEILNEEAIDILPLKRGNIHVQSEGQHVKLNNLSQVAVETFEDALKCLETGIKARTCGNTALNPNSSRSHSFFMVHMKRETENSIIETKLQLVDLAGSENSQKANTEGKRFKEGVNINKSLLHLGEMLTALSSKSTFVPYRNSILTRILADSLYGTSLTRIIACVNPNSSSMLETINTLRFATRARNIQPRTIQPRVGKENNPFRQDLDAIPKTPWRKNNHTFPLASPATPSLLSNRPTSLNQQDSQLTSTGFRIPPRPQFLLSPEMSTPYAPEMASFLSPLAEKVLALLKKQPTEIGHRQLHESSIFRLQETIIKRPASLVLDENLDVAFSPPPNKRSTPQPQDLQKFLSPLAKKVQVLMEESLNKRFQGLEQTIKNQLVEPTMNVRRSTRNLSPPVKDGPMQCTMITRRSTMMLAMNLGDSPASRGSPENSMLAMPPPKTTMLPKQRCKPKVLPRASTVERSKLKGTKATTPVEKSKSEESVISNHSAKDRNSVNNDQLRKAHTLDVLRLLNSGSKKEIQILPTVGAKAAYMISTYIKINGPFESIGSILNVGLKESFLKRFVKSNFLVLDM